MLHAKPESAVFQISAVAALHSQGQLAVAHTWSLELAVDSEVLKPFSSEVQRLIVTVQHSHCHQKGAGPGAVHVIVQQRPALLLLIETHVYLF